MLHSSPELSGRTLYFSENKAMFTIYVGDKGTMKDRGNRSNNFDTLYFSIFFCELH